MTANPNDLTRERVNELHTLADFLASHWNGDKRAGLVKDAADALESMALRLREVEAERDAAIEAGRRLMMLSDETHAEWDADNDSRVGKLLLAMGGHLPRYRAEIDKVIATLTAEKAEAQLSAQAEPELINDSFAADWLTNREPLHPLTVNLVVRFARALAKKLSEAEQKYGYSDGWMRDDWMDECRTKLLEHVAKGDPRDVAAYCAFLWHHDQSTASAHPAPPDADALDAKRYRWLRKNINYRDELRQGDVLSWHVRCWSHDSNDFVSDTLDAAIDAAMRGEG